VKPERWHIMLWRDGYIKVLDFGLAKLTERAAVVIRATIDEIRRGPGGFG